MNLKRIYLMNSNVKSIFVPPDHVAVTLNYYFKLLGACTSFHAPREHWSIGALLIFFCSRIVLQKMYEVQRSKGAKEQRKIKSAPMQREHWSKGAKEQRSIVAPRMTQDDSG